MGRLKRTQDVDRSPLYAPLCRLLDDVFVDTVDLAERYGYDKNTLSNLRRRDGGKRSFPYVRLPGGGIRYPVSGVVAMELQGTYGAMTLDRVKLLLLADPGLSEHQKAALSARLDKAFAGG